MKVFLIVCICLFAVGCSSTPKRYIMCNCDKTQLEKMWACEKPDNGSCE
jgi:hypothetical protein